MKKIIEKWYKKLNFPKGYDEEFYSHLEKFEFENPGPIEDYSTDPDNLPKNLMYHLYFCEQLSEKYREHGIPESVLLATLSDLPIWTGVCYSVYGIVGLRNSQWLKRHLSFKLFRLGRLQFCLGEFEKSYPQIDAVAGEPVIEVHIAEGEPLLADECDKSFGMAREFFEKYFTSHKYRYFTCHSWLLDKDNDVISKGSNIRSFAERFTELEREESDAILRYVFRYDTNRENLMPQEAKTSLAKRIKERVARGGSFYEVLGYIEK